MTRWWKSEVQLPGSKAGTGKLKLWTNISGNEGTLVGGQEEDGGGGGGQSSTKKDPVPVSLLKSALQKNVRLSRAEEATRVASQLIQMGHLEDLLRRIVIIVFEDAILHPTGVVMVVWLMMAVTRGFKPDMHLVSDVLQVVHDVASTKWKDWDFGVYTAALNKLKVNDLIGLHCRLIVVVTTCFKRSPYCWSYVVR